jgi:hypothetical protein
MDLGMTDESLPVRCGGSGTAHGHPWRHDNHRNPFEDVQIKEIHKVEASPRTRKHGREDLSETPRDGEPRRSVK